MSIPLEAELEAKAASDAAAAMGSIPVAINGELLGGVVTWECPSAEVPYVDVIAALTKADLSLDAAPELKPRAAFTRTSKHLKESRQIDKVSDDRETRLRKFQLTKLDRSNGHIGFTQETFVYLNLDTGDITCDNAEIQEQARKLFAVAMSVRTSSDITRIVQNYFRTNGDLFSLNSKGVAYFVPQRFADFTAKIEVFFKAMGGKFLTFPVPKGTKVGNQSVREAVDAGLATMAAELSAAVDAWDDTTRESTMEKAVQRWQEISVKVDAYAEYLEASQGTLRETLTAAKQSLAEKIIAVGQLKEQAAARKAAEKENAALDATSAPLLDAIEKAQATPDASDSPASDTDTPPFDVADDTTDVDEAFPLFS